MIKYFISMGIKRILKFHWNDGGNIIGGFVNLIRVVQAPNTYLALDGQYKLFIILPTQMVFINNFNTFQLLIYEHTHVNM